MNSATGGSSCSYTTMEQCQAMAAGRAVVTTPLGIRWADAPGDAVISIDMRTDPTGTATVIRELLAAPGWRKALGERAAQIAAPRYPGRCRRCRR